MRPPSRSTAAARPESSRQRSRANPPCFNDAPRLSFLPVMSQPQFPKVAQLKDVSAFRAAVRERGLDLPCDGRVLCADEASPLAEPLDVGGFVVGNRWCVHPMEGWDGTPDGLPSEHTLRRWKHFGESGCKLIWGGEAFAV